MRRKAASDVVVLVFLLTYLAGGAVFAEDGRSTTKVEVTRDVGLPKNSGLPENVSHLQTYVVYPTSKKALPPGEYDGVVVEFAAWLKRVIKPDVLPKKELILRNLLLVPAGQFAGGQGGVADVAYLGFGAQDGNMPWRIMVAQTGGSGGAVYVTLRVPQSNNTENWAPRRAFEETIGACIALPPPFSAKSFSDKKKGEVITFQMPENDMVSLAHDMTKERKLELAPFFSMKTYAVRDVLVFTFPKLDAEKSRAARPPAPKNWFEFRKRQREVQNQIRVHKEKAEAKLAARRTALKTVEDFPGRDALVEVFQGIYAKNDRYLDAEARLKAAEGILKKFHTDVGSGKFSRDEFKRARVFVAASLAKLASVEPNRKGRAAMVDAASGLLKIESDTKATSEMQQDPTVQKLINRVVDGENALYELMEMEPAALKTIEGHLKNRKISAETKRKLVEVLVKVEAPELYGMLLRILKESDDPFVLREAYAGVNRILKSWKRTNE